MGPLRPFGSLLVGLAGAGSARRALVLMFFGTLIALLSHASGARAQAQPPTTPAPEAAPTNPEALRKLREADGLSAAGRHQEALRAYKAADRIERSPATLRGIAQANETLGNPAGAYSAYAELLKLLASSGGDPNERAQVSAKLEALDQRTGHLRVTISEIDARVLVNGQLVGTTPLKEPLRLSNGVYTVSIQKPGFAEFRQQVTIQHDEALILGPLVSDPTQGSLSVRTKSGRPAQLLIDGKEIGPLPWRGSIARGTHDLVARTEDGYAAGTLTVRIAPSEHKEVVLDLVEQSGEVTVATASGYDEIRIDGFLVGRGRFTGRLKPGRHRVEITRGDALPFVRELDVTPGANLFVEGSPTPVPSAKLTQEERDRKALADESGLYIRLFLNGVFGANERHDLTTSTCTPKGSGGSCDSRKPLGGGGGGRLGYRFGMLAVEGLGIWDVSVASSKVSFANRATTGDFEGVPRLERYAIWRYGAALGAGLRLTTLTPGIRFSAGVSGALAWHNIGWARTVTPDATYVDAPIVDSSDDSPYLSPLVLGDAGITLGTSPGVQFVIALQAMLEFAPKTTVPGKEGLKLGYEPGTGGVTQLDLESPELTLIQGMQVYWGPVLGLQFGY